MIKWFLCENFRNVTCDRLHFERINILIGPNNGGKSNLIKALSFAANMVNSPKDETTGFLSEIKRNGWQASSNRRTSDTTFKLVWNFELSERPVVYTLHANVGNRRDNNFILEESLDSAEVREGTSEPYNYFNCHGKMPGVGKFSTAGLSNTKNQRLIAEVNPSESVLLQMDNLFFENKSMFSVTFVRDEIRNVLENMRTYFKSFYSYSCTTFNISEIREIQDEQNEGSYLKKDGSNFVNVFNDLAIKDPEFKENFLKILRKLITNCEDIHIMNAGSKIWMELQIDGCNFALSEVSDGTIHLLLLLLMLTVPERSGISLLAIDEPEMNLHPAWQKQLANEILRCKSFKQCFISTHSPDFLDEFTENYLLGDVALFVFDPYSKHPIRKLEKEELSSELQDWTLGDLYRIGDPVIGGWPQ